MHGLADGEVSNPHNRFLPLTMMLGNSAVHTETRLIKRCAYLVNLWDDMLFEKPFPKGEDKDLILWQVLLHVGNHGAGHRAQFLRLLSDLGVKTMYQDYIFYVYEHP